MKAAYMFALKDLEIIPELKDTCRNLSKREFICSECTFCDCDLFREYEPKYCPECGRKVIRE